MYDILSNKIEAPIVYDETVSVFEPNPGYISKQDILDDIDFAEKVRGKFIITSNELREYINCLNVGVFTNIKGNVNQ